MGTTNLEKTSAKDTTNINMSDGQHNKMMFTLGDNTLSATQLDDSNLDLRSVAFKHESSTLYSPHCADQI